MKKISQFGIIVARPNHMEDNNSEQQKVVRTNRQSNVCARKKISPKNIYYETMRGTGIAGSESELCWVSEWHIPNNIDFMARNHESNWLEFFECVKTFSVKKKKQKRSIIMYRCDRRSVSHKLPPRTQSLIQSLTRIHSRWRTMHENRKTICPQPNPFDLLLLCRFTLKANRMNRRMTEN